MAQVSVDAVMKYVKTRQGMAVVVLVLLVLIGGVYYAMNRPKSKPVADSNTSQSANKAVDPQIDASTTDATAPVPSPAVTDSPDATPATTPGATPIPGTPPAPGLPPAAYADNFGGDWYINFGTMVLTQSGTTVTGTYYNGPQAKSGTVSGTVSGQVLTGTWAINGSHGPLTLTKGTHTLAGGYSALGGSTSYKWCGALKGYQFPADCGFAGHWVTKIPSNATCAMDLVRTNNSVTGTYCNGTLASSTISYPIGETKLSGTWKLSGGTTGTFGFFLSSLASSPHQLYFQGSYPTNNAWCGGTTAGAQPATCLKT